MARADPKWHKALSLTTSLESLPWSTIIDHVCGLLLVLMCLLCCVIALGPKASRSLTM